MPKKKTALTIEERLQQALVPAEEQPYKVPENWVWVRLESVASWGSGGTPSRKHEEYYNGDILWIKTGELNNGWIYDTEEKITDEGLKKSSAKLFPPYSVLIAMYGATIGKVAILGVPATTNQACACAVCNQSLLYMYLFYYCISQKNVFIEKGKGGAQPNISQIILKQHPIPLPPLSEQQRIVERIEELFAKLDEAKERLQEVADSFAVRKAAILHKAFTGELTKQWRRENGVSDESWEEKTLQDVCSMKITDGTHKTPVYCDSEKGVKFLSAKDITAEKICWDNIKYIVPELHEELYKRLAPQVDDVLLAKNGTTGVAAIVETDDIFDIYVTLAVLRPEKSIIYPLYLLKVVNSPLCKEQFAQHLTGIGVPNLHLRDIKEVLIPLPTIPEQHEIVRLIDDLLARERSAQQATEQALASIDLMKKSILARAFRGELGTNKASEASALELLKQVLAEN
ncbi:restriction endonuclease subunit S [Phascolarctobacterium succinatutens]|uniref:restriction endonuclease subunit S n=1 Tax=Phascolarctobacterium succinatutens TaxID=626940 RepID=UPI00266EBDE6|nr:restriction endonuclease subunit S [Phascolarctobacterium succinatutens]